MDVEKTMIAINEFQNALARVRSFKPMIDAADILWNELQNVTEDELLKLANHRDSLTAQIATLEQHLASLKG